MKKLLAMAEENGLRPTGIVLVHARDGEVGRVELIAQGMGEQEYAKTVARKLRSEGGANKVTIRFAKKLPLKQLDFFSVVITKKMGAEKIKRAALEILHSGHTEHTEYVQPLQEEHSE